MTYNFDNYSLRSGSRGGFDWYEWTVFISKNEPDEKLKKVEFVEYQLDPSFPKPIRTEYNRANRFALRSAGWGRFRLLITVHLKDGTEIFTVYELELKKAWPPDDPEIPRPSI
jgi:transcription initiation factor IIF auxiliary subunit